MQPLRVFISWSGGTSKALATIIADVIADVLDRPQVFISTGMKPGQRWSNTIASNLASIDCGIIAVTKDNVAAPWIHFEAGALSKNMDQASVIPILFDCELDELAQTPLSQFQARSIKTGDTTLECGKDSVHDVLDALNVRGQPPIDPIVFDRRFTNLWPVYGARLQALRSQAAVPQGDASSIARENNLDSLLRQLLRKVEDQGTLLNSLTEYVSRLGPQVSGVAERFRVRLAESPVDPNIAQDLERRVIATARELRRANPRIALNALIDQIASLVSGVPVDEMTRLALQVFKEPIG